MKRIRDISISKKLYFTVGIMALLIAIELFMLVFMIRTLSATRAYVGAEGLWSKAQKDAVYNLRKYGASHDEKHYQAYLSFLKVQLGDRKTRLELGKKDPDMDVARQGFIEGRFHPDDIDGAIKLFRRFHSIYYINKAIAYWTQGDSLIAELQVQGNALKQKVSGNFPQEEIDRTLEKIDALNQELTVLEDNFSFTLGEGSRWLEGLVLKILFSIALTVEFTGLFLTISVSMNISKGINEIVRVSSRVANADFSERAKVFSRDEIGVLAGSFNQMRDNLKQKIDEHKRTGEELRKQRDLYETLLKAQSEMGEGVVISEGPKIIYANEAFCRMYGYTEEEILNMPNFIDVVVEEDRDRLAKRFRERLYTDSMSDVGETSVVRKDGRIINIEYSSKMIQVEGRPQLISIVKDITEKKTAAKTLESYATRLEQSNKELEKFAYIASHDLQEPLRTIISYLQLLEKRYKNKLGEEADEFINFAVDGAKRMHVLINDMLAYSRVSTKEKAFEKIDVKSILDIVLNNLDVTIKKNSARILIDGKMPTIMADASQLIQLLQNMIDNAIKYRSEQKPEIHIAAQKKGGSWLFSIKDNGIGIAEEYWERIFIIFQRLHSREKYEGTGIGLAVCKKIVERHGGKIWVESKVDEGSTFFFTIKNEKLT